MYSHECAVCFNSYITNDKNGNYKCCSKKCEDIANDLKCSMCYEPVGSGEYLYYRLCGKDKCSYEASH